MHNKNGQELNIILVTQAEQVLSDHHPKHPPSKKELIRARNKHTLIVNQLSDLANAPIDGAHAVSHAEDVHNIALSTDPQPKTVMGAATRTRLDLIRNKISGRKRVAKDRWNRFAGTSGGGGKGL